MKIKSINKFNPKLLTILLHILIVSILYFILLKLGVVKTVPDNLNLIRWDTEWYLEMKKYGYIYKEKAMCSVAFFPLFPFAWYVTNFSAIGISIFNLVVFLIGFCLISTHLKLKPIHTLLFLSTPSLFFCFIPYTEALFFLSSTILLIGLDKDRLTFILVGILFASLSRAAGTVFIPAILFTYLLTTSKETYRRDLEKTVICVLLIMSTTLFVAYIQYLFTNKWFVFLDVQKYWNRNFGIPVLPFTSLTGAKTLWLDGLAFFICVTAGLVGLQAIWKKIFKPETHFQRGYIFSLAYLVLVGLLSVCFSGVWDHRPRTKGLGTVLMSLNRFVFATPFFIFFINKHLADKKNIQLRSLSLIVVIFLLVSLSLGAYRILPDQPTYLSVLLYFSNMLLYVIIYFFSQANKTASLFVYFINVITMLILLDRHLQNGWVG